VRYYAFGIPFSDDLSHSGIPGQKWGLRRFQNKDRTWTEAGKERYGRAARLKEKIGNAYSNFKEKRAARKAAAEEKRAAIEAEKEARKKEYEERIGFKKKNVGSFSDEELKRYTDRLKLENEYYAALSNNKPKRSEGHEFVAKLAKDGLTTISNKAFQTAANKMFDKPEARLDDFAIDLAEKTYRNRATNSANDWQNAVNTIQNIAKIRAAMEGTLPQSKK
jgi:hypothetical protein